VSIAPLVALGDAVGAALSELIALPAAIGLADARFGIGAVVAAADVQALTATVRITTAAR
jgi:hypothetical protein